MRYAKKLFPTIGGVTSESTIPVITCAIAPDVTFLASARIGLKGLILLQRLGFTA